MSAWSLRGRSEALGSRDVLPDQRASEESSPLPSTSRAASHTAQKPDVDLVPGTRVELNSLPRDFLEAFPYPAFVLVTAIPPSAEHSGLWTPTPVANIHPLTPVWANSRWNKLASGKSAVAAADGSPHGKTSLLDCLSLESVRRFGAWLMADESPEKSSKTDKMDNSGLGVTLNSPGGTPNAATTQGASTSIGKELEFTDLEKTQGYFDDEADPEPTLTLDFEFAGHDDPVVLELTKTAQPIYIWRKAERSVVCTHVFTVITALPRSRAPNFTRLDSGVGDLVSSPKASTLSSMPDALQSAPAPPAPDKKYAPPGDAGQHAFQPPPLVHPVRVDADKNVGAPVSGPPPVVDCTTPSLVMPGRRVRPAVSTPLVQHPDAVRIIEEGTESGQCVFFLRNGGLQRPLPEADMGVSADGRPLNTNLLLKSVDWSKSPLGPEAQWPDSLKCMVGFLNVLPLCAAMWWGKDLTLFYNQGYSQYLQNHPSIYGESGTASWAELWTTLGPLSEVVLKGSAIFKEDDFMLQKRPDRDAYYENYSSQLWAPFKLPDGSFGGVFHSVVETTRRVLAERRSVFLRDLQERTSNALSIEDFYRGTLEVVENNPRDAPFALLFTVDTQNQPKPIPRRLAPGEPEQRPCVRAKVRYVCGVGVPEKHVSAPAVTDVTIAPRGDPSEVVLASAFSNPELQGVTSPSAMGRSPSLHPMGRERQSSLGSAAGSSSSLGAGGLAHAPVRSASATKELAWPDVFDYHSGKPVLIEDCSTLIKGYPVRVWDELPTSAVVIPILQNKQDDVPIAMLVLGLSPRLPFDESYEEFIHILRSQLSTQLAAIRGYHADQLRIQELGTLDRTKSELFANVAQQLFTPLALVAGPLDDAIVDMEPGSPRDMLKLARRNVRRLTNLASILRDVGSLESGRLKGSFELVNLGELTRDGAALFRRAAGKSHLEYIVDCDVAPQEVYVDREKWDKIMFALIGNAIHYTPQGSIRVSLAYQDNEAVFSVQDTGIGIPAADLKYIGEEFYRAEYPGKQDGSGVMLPFAKKLVEMHSGVLEVESVSSLASTAHGSTFRVRIPLGSAHLPPDSIAAEGMGALQRADGWGRSDAADALFEDSRGESSVGSRTASPRGSDMGTLGSSPATSPSRPGASPNPNLSASPVHSPLSPVVSRDERTKDKTRRARGIDPSTLWFDPSDVIMIVDDLQDTRRYLHSILSPFCRVVEARDGSEALAQFDMCRPDLIVSELSLPRSNGVELLHALRAGTKEQRMVPFLLLTSGDERPADALLVDDVLSKPFNARELVARAHMQLQLGKKRRALERMFDERTRELRIVTDKMPIGIFQCTPDGYVSYANEAWYEFAGYPRDTRVTNWGDYVHADDQARVRGVWEAYITQGLSSASAEWRWTNGRYTSTKVISLQGTGDDKAMGSIGCCVDITDRILHETLQKQRVAEAEQRRAEAEEAKSQQELLIDITSHEIRNPIGSLMQEQLQRSLDSDGVFTPTTQLLLTIGEDLEALDSIYECGLTQERISNDVLSLGKIQLDMMQMCDDDRPVRREAAKLTSVFQNEARMKRIALTLNVSPAFDALGIVSVKTDHVRLGQVVTNLLTNAIRFTANSPVRKIELGIDIGLEPPATGCDKPPPKPSTVPLPVAEDTPVYLFVSVADTGPGLTPHELAMLFQRFSQASPKTHTVYGGSGLGLFVSRKLTELMGGRIDVSSQPGCGSKFSFFIAAKAGALGVLPTPAATAAAPAPLRTTPLTRVRDLLRERAHKWRVLVVEDNLINRTVLLRQLKHVGLEADDAEDGQEALDKIRAAMSRAPSAPAGKPYDVVLMDLEMPIMDGYTAAQRVRALEDAGELEPSLVIALTGNARQARIDAAMADFDDVVVKPYRLDDLLRKMEAVIRQRAEGAPAPSMRRRADAAAVKMGELKISGAPAGAGAAAGAAAGAGASE